MSSRVANTIVSVSVSILLALSLSLFPVMPAADAQASELDDAASALEDAKDKAEEAQAAKDAADAAVAQTEASIAEIESVLPEQQKKAGEVVRQIYRSGGEDGMALSLLDVLLSSNSFSDMVRNLEAWNTIMDYRNGIVEQSIQSKKQLEADREVLVEQQSQAAAALEEADAAKDEAQKAYNKAVAAAASIPKTSSVDWSAASGGILTLSQMKFRGVVNYAGYRYTYYSQSVLPGHGLRIPGRHVEKGCVVDGDGYICVASSTHAKGTVVPTPLVEFPQGKVYDSGCAPGTIDLYIA